MGRIVVGVDGGATKTRVIVADADGNELATLTGTASAVRPGEARHSADVIGRLVGEALAACDQEDETPEAVCIGVAGVGRDAEYSAFMAAMAERPLAEEMVVLPDFFVALEDAFGDESGIVLIAGTGSVAYRRGPTGKMGRCGGGGPPCV